MLEGHEVLAGLQLVELFLFLFDLFLIILSSLDGQANAAVGAVDLDHGLTRIDIQHVLDLVHALADLRNVHEAVHVVFQADEGPKLASLVTLPLTSWPT